MRPMAKPNPITALAERLVQTLRDLRDRGTETYPTTRTALAVLAAPEASPTDVAKAFKKKPFAGDLFLAHKRELQNPVSLAEDAGRLTASRLLLDFAFALI